MKKIMSLLFLVCIFVVTICPMEYKPIYKCDIHECNVTCFSQDKLDQHKKKHKESCYGKRYFLTIKRKPLSTDKDKVSLVRVVINRQKNSYKKFCEIEAKISGSYGVINTISALPSVKPKSKIGKKYWYLKKDECCKRLADQHPSKYKLHVLQKHPERYDITMHPLNCLGCEFIKSRQKDRGHQKS